VFSVNTYVMCTVLLVRTLVIMESVEGGVTGGCVLRSRAEDGGEGAIGVHILSVSMAGTRRVEGMV
jgi:hypothetical protein